MKAIETFHRHLEKEPDRRYYIDVENDRLYTRAEFYNESLKLSSFLKDIGIKSGGRIAVIMPNSVEFALFYFASLCSRITIIPLNPILHPSEVEFILKTCQPAAIFFAPSTAEKITQPIRQIFKDRLYGIKIRQESDKEIPVDGRVFSSEEIFSQFSPAQIDFTRILDDHLFTITYTSGTTQTPKGVMHNFKNFVNNAEHFIARVEIGKENSFYGVLSLAYMGGFYNLLFLPWIAGASVGFRKSFDALTAITFWDAPMKYNLNSLWFVPTMMAVLLKVDRGTKGENYARQNVRLALAGTAPLPVKLRSDFEQRYGIKIYESYGLSETLFVTTNSPQRQLIDGSVGRPLDGIGVAIRNDAGGDLSAGEEGEIFVKTDDLMIGYYEGDVKSKNAQVEGREWFATGDVGSLDQKGNLFITGRKKDLIIRGGINISPGAIENIIIEHRAISEVAVVGIPHELYGENIAAVVKVKPGFSLRDIQSELEVMCMEKLGQIRKPSMFFEIEEFPKSTTGKIQKNKLRQMLKEKIGE